MPPTNRRILFINPHADDTEVLYSSTCQAAVEAGFEVHECLSNADEYGTPRIDFRGRRLARIRKKEMYKAAQVYGVDASGRPKIILHWLPYIDGHVPFNRESINRYRTLIEEIRPWAIFGPDPFFAMDKHPDHIQVGRNYFFALRNIPEDQRPRWMFFYQTLKANWVFPYKSEEIEYRARIAHKSQLAPLEMKIFRAVGWIWKRSVLNHGQRADKFRKVTFDADSNQINPKKWDCFTRLKVAFWQNFAQIGYQKPAYFAKPPMQEILADYRKNGWV
jgi:LmbE family N-acetylglucosaminyl deacetylase